MSEATPLQTTSAKLKKALTWMSEILRDHPEQSREAVLRQAELRYDLTPAECEFLDKHFG